MRALHCDFVDIYNCALPNKPSQLPMYIPLDENDNLVTPAASLAPPKGNHVERTVLVQELDDVGFENIDLLKIDAEARVI